MTIDEDGGDDDGKPRRTRKRGKKCGIHNKYGEEGDGERLGETTVESWC